MATSRRYSKAPIVEAIIDLRVEHALTEREMNRLRDRFKTQFPSIEEKRNFTIEVGPKPEAKQQSSSPAGFKMTGKNGTDLVLINEASFGTVRLAPYDRWEIFVQQAKDNFEVFTKVVGRKKITRVGVRFINRLDIPNQLITNQPISKFLRTVVVMPDGLTRIIGAFNFVVEGRELETDTPFIVRSAVIAPPPLIEHVSFLLDIDAFWDAAIPDRLDDMWDGTERLRQAKNAIFEQSITDDLRRLFE